MIIRATLRQQLGALLLLFAITLALADRGALNPDLTQSTIAQTIYTTGYTQSVRPASSFTNGVKALLLKRPGLDPSMASDYGLDHIIPLAIGGHPRSLNILEWQPWEPL